MEQGEFPKEFQQFEVRTTESTEKYWLSIKNCLVLFKEVLVKKDFDLGLLNQKAFFKEKSIFFFEPPLKPKSIKSNNTFSRYFCGNLV